MWCRYTSVNYAIIGSDNGLLPVWHQAIIWISAGILFTGSSGLTWVKFDSKYKRFSLKKRISKCRLGNGCHFILASVLKYLNIFSDWTYIGFQRFRVSQHLTVLRHQQDPDNKVHGANMGPTWVLLAPDGPHVSPMNLAIEGSKA